MQRSAIAAMVVAAACAGAGPAWATVLTETLSTAIWPDGATAIGTGNFAAAGPDPAPFDTLIGNKNLPGSPSTSFAFAGYGGPIATPITSATLEIGLYDASSPDPATEVNFFTLNGDSIAVVLTAALVATNPVRNGEVYYTLVLPSAVYADLATGTSTFSLGFTGPGLGLLAPSSSILFGLDFATLTVNTGTTPPPHVGEPPAAGLLLAGLLGLAALRRRQAG